MWLHHIGLIKQHETILNSAFQLFAHVMKEENYELSIGTIMKLPSFE